VELGRQSLDAESKKYSLGASTNTLVSGAAIWHSRIHAGYGTRVIRGQGWNLIAPLVRRRSHGIDTRMQRSAQFVVCRTFLRDASLPDQPNPLMNQPTAQPTTAESGSTNQAQPNQAEPMQSQPNQIQAQPAQPPQ
jgi:hypothetical protein